MENNNTNFYWYIITDCANLGSEKRRVNGMTMRNVFIGYPDEDTNGLSYEEVFASLL